MSVGVTYTKNIAIATSAQTGAPFSLSVTTTPQTVYTVPSGSYVVFTHYKHTQGPSTPQCNVLVDGATLLSIAQPTPSAVTYALISEQKFGPGSVITVSTTTSTCSLILYMVEWRNAI